MKREFRPGTTIIHAETANRPEVRRQEGGQTHQLALRRVILRSRQ